MAGRRFGRSRLVAMETGISLAATEGLGRVTLGRLAAEAGLSKSGLFTLFGSKEALHLAIVAAAASDRERSVLGRLERCESGLERLAALLERWLGHLEWRRAGGGSFLAAAAAEVGGRPGPVRDRLASLASAWLRNIREEATLAVRLGQLRPDSDPARIAFELQALVHEAHAARRLLDDESAFPRARAAIQERLALDATAAGARALERSRRRTEDLP